MATIGIIDDDARSWPQEILLDGCTYNSFAGNSTPTDSTSRINWLSRMNPQKYTHDFWPQPYEECARVMRNAGNEEGAKEVLIEKERLQQQAIYRKLSSDLAESCQIYRQSAKLIKSISKTILDRPRHAVKRLRTSNKTYMNIDLLVSLLIKLVIDRPARWVIGYGHQPLRAVVPLIGLMLLGGIVFSMADAAGGMRPNHPNVLFSSAWINCDKEQHRKIIEPPKVYSQLDCYMRKPEGRNYPSYNAFAYSVDALLPIVSLDVQPYWSPDNRYLAGKIGAVYLKMHIFLGWALTLLAVAGFSGLVKTGGSSK